MVKQIKGEYKVKNERIISMYNMTVPLIEKLDSFEIIHVKRELNKKADKLVNEAIDNR